MRRFYLPHEECQGDRFCLTGNEAHHAANVLRIKTGTEVSVLDGTGNIFSCEVERVSKREIGLKVNERQTVPSPACQITLIQSLPKGKTMDLIVQKATELGTMRIIPLLSERTDVRLTENEAKRKVEKWKTTAIESIKQCGSPWLPRIDLPVSTNELLAREIDCELQLVASLEERDNNLRTRLDQFCCETQRPPKSIAIWIGPEGDFSPEEYTALRAKGVQPITLGNLILRSETATIYCLSTINYEASFFGK